MSSAAFDPAAGQNCPAIPCGSIFPFNLSIECADANYCSGTMHQCAIAGAPVQIFLRAPGFGPWSWSVGGLPPGLGYALASPCSGTIEIYGSFPAAGTFSLLISSTDTVGNETPGILKFDVQPAGQTCPPGSILPVPPFNLITPYLYGTGGDTIASLAWTPSEGATSYTLTRINPDSSTYDFPGITSVLALDTGLTNGATYAYRVKAVNSLGESPESNAVSVKPTGAAPSAAPTVAGASGNGYARLWWTPVAGATSYTITRNGSELAANLPLYIPASPYYDNGLTNNHAYTYQVFGVNSSGAGPSSKTITLTPSAPPPPPPHAPSTPTLQGTAGDSFNQLSWTPSSSATAYGLSRSDVGVIYFGPQTNYQDNSAVNGVSYTYTVSASNGAGASHPSNSVTLTPAATVTAPTITGPPGSVAQIEGTSVTLSVTATGTAPLTYQWWNLGGAIAGATGSSYTIPWLQPVNAGAYWVVVSNSAGSASSQPTPSIITVNQVTVTTGPASISVAVGQPASFSVVATFATSYRWFGPAGQLVNTPGVITGADTATVTLLAVTALDVGSYSVTVGDGVRFVLPAAATLTVTGTVTSAPVLSGAAGNRSVALTWTAATGATSYTLTRTDPISGTLVTPGLTNLNFHETGLTNGVPYTYTVEGVNTGGNGPLSNSVILTPTAPPPPPPPPPPVKPTNLVCSWFEDDVSNYYAITSSWDAVCGLYFDHFEVLIEQETAPGVWVSFADYNITGGGSSHYDETSSAVQLDTTAIYRVSIRGWDNGAWWTPQAGPWSDYAYPSLPLPEPSVSDPLDLIADDGADVQFTVAASGYDPLTYQWYFNGAAIGPDADTLDLTGVHAPDSGQYWVTVQDAFNRTATSNPATLTVSPPPKPVIDTESTGGTVPESGSIALSVTAHNGTLTYQWEFMAAGGSAWTTINDTTHGSNTATYTLTNARQAETGKYHCVVTNTGGSVTSTAQTVTVSSIFGYVGAWDTLHVQGSSGNLLVPSNEGFGIIAPYPSAYTGEMQCHVKYTSASTWTMEVDLFVIIAGAHTDISSAGQVAVYLDNGTTPIFNWGPPGNPPLGVGYGVGLGVGTYYGTPVSLTLPAGAHKITFDTKLYCGSSGCTITQGANYLIRSAGPSFSWP